MKKIVLLLLSIVFSLTAVKTANAQSDVSVSAPYDEVRANAKLYFTRGEEVMALKFRGMHLTIQKYNTKTPGLISTKEYTEDEVFPKGSMGGKVWEFSNRFYFFYTVWDNASKLNQILYREINFEEGRFAGEGKILFTLNRNKMSLVATGREGVLDFFHLANSNNNSKLLFFYKLKPDGKKINEIIDVIGIHVFDEHLAPVWQQDITMPYTEGRMDNARIWGSFIVLGDDNKYSILNSPLMGNPSIFGISSPNNIIGDNNQFSIDDVGNVYMLATVFNNDKDYIKEYGKDGKPNFHRELITIKANVSNVNITPINLEEKNVSSVRLFQLPNNNIICVGFYNKGEEMLDADGVFLAKVDSEGTLSSLKTYEIPLEILNQFVNESDKQKNEKLEKESKAEFEKLTMQEIKITSDGSLLFIGEQAWTKSVNSKSMMLPTDNYYSNSLLITKIDASNNLVWMKRIPKTQYAEGKRGNTGYKYLFANGSHYFLFIDNEKNQNLTINQEPEKYIRDTKGLFTDFKINDSSGEVKRETIFNTDDVKGFKINKMEIDNIRKCSATEFVFETDQKDNKDIMIKVTLK